MVVAPLHFSSDHTGIVENSPLSLVEALHTFDAPPVYYTCIRCLDIVAIDRLDVVAARIHCTTAMLSSSTVRPMISIDSVLD